MGEDHAVRKIGEAAVGYEGWLAKQSLLENMNRAYRTRARQFFSGLVATPAARYGDALSDSHARNYAFRENEYTPEVDSRLPNARSWNVTAKTVLTLLLLGRVFQIAAPTLSGSHHAQDHWYGEPIQQCQ